MANFDKLSSTALINVLDALADSAESFSNAAKASVGLSSSAFWDSLSQKYDNVADKLSLREDLDSGDIDTIVEALERSERNCSELDLDDVAAEYAQTAVEVRDLLRV